MSQAELKTHFTLPNQTHSQRMTADRLLARSSHYVHNFPLALPYISCSQIFFRLDCLYSLYDILVFFKAIFAKPVELSASEFRKTDTINQGTSPGGKRVS